MSQGEMEQIISAARLHYENLLTDINNAKDRIEHIRLTTLTQEARNLLTDLENMQPEEQQLAPSATFNESQEVLDLPDFKSPFNPDA